MRPLHLLRGAEKWDRRRAGLEHFGQGKLTGTSAVVRPAAASGGCLRASTRVNMRLGARLGHWLALTAIGSND